MAKTDEEKAAFMRAVGATHAEWHYIGSDGAPHLETLKCITLGPLPASAARQPGPAERMADFHERQKRQHEVLFAASSVRPKLAQPAPTSAVPRAVRAKEEAARRGEKAAG